MDLATALFEVMRAHGVSKQRLGAMLGINEKQVRKMLDGRTPIQLAIVSLLPVEMASDLVDVLFAKRGGHKVVVYDRDPAAVERLVKEGATGSSSLADMASKLEAPSCR